MKLLTEIAIPRSRFSIGYNDYILLLGSCFSSEIGEMMKRRYLHADINPFGTLYNPVSIVHHLSDDMIAQTGYTVFFITFGTAWVYVDRATGEVVDNCQKRPSSDFIRRRLTVKEIVELWQPMLEKYCECKFIFTVSPIRHVKDGLHENQVSKAICLQAIDELVEWSRANDRENAQVHYFPSYEIMLDELRDYRFYAADMKHPSQVAVDYIWERLEATYFYDEQTQRTMHELYQLNLDRQHRMLHPDSPEAEAFRLRTEETLRHYQSLYPWID